MSEVFREREEVLRELAQVVNRHSLENASNTPDFILAEVMLGALDTFTKASRGRERWYRKPSKIEYNPNNPNNQLYTNEEWIAKFGPVQVTNEDAND